MWKVLILLFILVYLCLTYYYFKFSVLRRPEPRFSESKYRNSNKYSPYAERIIDGILWFREQKTETVKIKSNDNLILVADLLPAINSDKVIILFHGYHSTAYNDFSYMIKYYHNKGYNLLLVNQRAHGKSEGKHIGFGVLERIDCLSWSKYVVDRFGKNVEIYLHGVSLGASSVLMASNAGLPDNVKGIIADSGFTSPNEIISKVIKDKYKLPGWLFVPAMSMYCNIFAHYGFYDFSTVDALANSSIPILIIHGKADDYVPCWMSKKSYDAAIGLKKILLVENAGHGMSYLEDEAKYLKEIENFLT